jgi:UDP-N-acetyl-D-mannosaminuronate dehydrogenase
MKKIGILGYGEIGKAVARFYKKPQIKDLNRDDELKGVDILHICIPWSDKFIEIVVSEIKNIQPSLTIIHSTVATGTTKEINNRLSAELKKVVHSPVRGVHPNLFEGIKTFVKYIGAEDLKTGKVAEEHLKSLGIKTKIFTPSNTTELGKLLDTTYYGVIIAWHGEMAKMTEELGVDFEKAVTDFNQTYNEGYARLNKSNVIRPVLYPPSAEGIGGHCVIPNAEILKDYVSSPAIDFLLGYKKMGINKKRNNKKNER